MRTLIHTLFFFLLVTQICFAQWVSLGLEDKGIKDIAVSNSDIFAVTSDSTVYRSTNNGSTWFQIMVSGAIDIAIAPSGSLFIIMGDSLNRSSDNGNTWVNITEQLPFGSGLTNITISPSGFVFCGYHFEGMGGSTHLAMSTDDGSTWTSPGYETYGGDLFDFRGQSVITSGYNWGPAHGYSYVYLSSDNGQNWLEVGNQPLFDNNVLSMCLNGNILIGGSNWRGSGLFLSSDSCNTWTQVSSLIPEAGLSIESGGMLIGTDSLGVFLFSDNGDSIGSFNEGLSNLNTHTLSTDNNDYVYLGTDNGVWRRPLSEITSVEEHSADLPSSYILSQNYPNPFNPSTVFRYSIPNESKVIIKVYDVLGKEIETLVNEEKTLGTYELTWYAENLPSGVYFYQLRAGSFVETKKMVLMK